MRFAMPAIIASLFSRKWYKWAKGSVQFPLDKPIPYELISKIVKFKVAENQEK